MIHTSRASAAVLLIASLVLWVLPTVPARGTAQHAAGLVVDTGERVVTVYVRFPSGAETISGEELLRLADVDAVFGDYGSMGKAVCSILGVGSPQDDCFREAERNGLYWNYSRAEDGGWRRSSRGVSTTTVEHGDVDGWAWGPQGSLPPYHSFEEIEARHAPDQEPSPTPSATPSPSPEPAAEAPQEPAEPQTSTAAQERGRTTPSSATVNDTSTAHTGAPASETASAEATDDPGSVPPTEDVEEDPTQTPTQTPSPTVGASEQLAASPLAVDRERSATGGFRSLITFLAVMAALIGGIVWRRRDRSGTGPGSTGA